MGYYRGRLRIGYALRYRISVQERDRLMDHMTKFAVMASTGAFLMGGILSDARAQEMPKQLNHYLSIASAGSFYKVRVNDVAAVQDFESLDRSVSIPINTLLREGENEISVTMVSVLGPPIQYNVANPEFYFEADLEALELSSRARENVTLLNLSIDTENALIQPDVKRVGSQIHVRDSAPMATADSVLDETQLSSGWGDGSWTARRMTRKFQVDGSFPAFPWARAPVIPDNSQLRQQLLEAYRSLHATLASADRDRVLSAYKFAWAHVASTMHYATVDEFIQKAGVFEDLAPADENGYVLQPLDLVRGADFEIERMAGGRLIRISPDPIVWTKEGSELVKSTNVAFFLDESGVLQIGVVLL